MISDNATFFLAFAAVFISIGAYLWMMDRKLRRMEDRILAVEVLNEDDAKK